MLPAAIRTSEGRGMLAEVAYRHARTVEVVKAATLLVQRMRHTGTAGLYEINPEVVLRLRSAIDDLPANEVEKGDDKWA